MTNKRTII